MRWMILEHERQIDTGPYLKTQIIPEDPEVVAAREGIHKRIQAEIQQEDKEAEVLMEEMLYSPPSWNEVPASMMETEDGRMIPEAATTQKERRNSPGAEETGEGR